MYTEHARHDTPGESFQEALVTEQALEEDGPDPELELLMTAWKKVNDSDAEDVVETIFDEDEAKEILSTMIKERSEIKKTFCSVLKAKKNRDLARGFGAGRDGTLRPGTYKVSIEELKRRTRCRNCKEIGHWAKECPKKARSTREIMNVVP